MAIVFAILAVIVGIVQLIVTFKFFFRNSGDYFVAWREIPPTHFSGKGGADAFKWWFYHGWAVFSGIAVYFGLMKIFT